MAEKNIVPILEADVSDGNAVSTPRQWLERFRQFTNREHKRDITPLLKCEDVTGSGWSGKKNPSKYQITRAEYKTEPDSIEIKDLIRLLTEYYLPKRNTYHSRE